MAGGQLRGQGWSKLSTRSQLHPKPRVPLAILLLFSALHSTPLRPTSMDFNPSSASRHTTQRTRAARRTWVPVSVRVLLQTAAALPPNAAKFTTLRPPYLSRPSHFNSAAAGALSYMITTQFACH
jgi:hypothetical protein